MGDSGGVSCYGGFAESVFQHVLIFTKIYDSFFCSVGITAMEGWEFFLPVRYGFANFFKIGNFFEVFRGYLYFMTKDLIFIIGDKVVNAIFAIFKLRDKTFKANFTFIYG